MLQEETEDCLVVGLDHTYDFAGASNGKSYWVCVRCPATVEESEDCLP